MKNNHHQQQLQSASATTTMCAHCGQPAIAGSPGYQTIATYFAPQLVGIGWLELHPVCNRIIRGESVEEAKAHF